MIVTRAGFVSVLTMVAVSTAKQAKRMDTSPMVNRDMDRVIASTSGYDEARSGKASYRIISTAMEKAIKKIITHSNISKRRFDA